MSEWRRREQQPGEKENIMALPQAAGRVGRQNHKGKKEEGGLGVPCALASCTSVRRDVVVAGLPVARVPVFFAHNYVIFQF